MTTRDRDPAGRPRNARPRDAAGRPLPRGAQGIDRVPDDLVLTPDATVDEAQRLIDGGLPFQAHEVLEAAWKATEGGGRDMWQGLAQLAVGLTHLQRGNGRGAVALLRRGADRIEPYAADPPHALDLAGLVRQARAVADRVEQAGPEGVPEPDARFRLRGR
ncbi:DUF309 domain-containing protein [Gandjariella thermophila]|uniref:DUF309 domain-containing protein n=1 Tax=Gandjariella thermophila TaxID=1931992 RepID=A0A4D4JEI8_9PSEU|nr:DUF309 domain-containing protein [Gandjariella thermophila]GDY32327.1 hypothetical protein GTS_39600 [Gandjariella thermophila]